MICGYDCESVKFDFGRFAMTYFYSRQLPVNSEYFKNHHYNFYDKFFEESKSICLKTIMEYEDMRYIRTAIKVEKVKIDKKQFESPKNAEKYQKSK